MAAMDTMATMASMASMASIEVEIITGATVAIAVKTLGHASQRQRQDNKTATMASMASK